jgi:hypothetical protein
MNKLAFSLVTFVLIGSCFAQTANMMQAGTMSPAKRILAGSLEITAVDTKYANWQSQYYSVSAWGVRVHVANTTDHEVSEKFSEADLKVTDASGKQYSISDQYQNVFAEINLNDIFGQGLQGTLLFAKNGVNAAIILKGDKTIGELSRDIDESNKANIHNTYTIKLAPRKSVTLVFLFDCPMGLPPTTLLWPKANPIDLR